jgi:hypothetical protein
MRYGQEKRERGRTKIIQSKGPYKTVIVEAVGFAGTEGMKVEIKQR